MTDRRIFAVVVAGCLSFAGCAGPEARSAGGGLGMPSMDWARQIAPSPRGARDNGTVFVWDGISRTVIFDAAGKQLGTIPYYGELATDSEANLYIADSAEENVIRIYKPPYTGNPKFLFMPKGRLVNFVAVDQRTGVIAAVTSLKQIGEGYGGVEFYRHGETKPCRTVRPQQGIVFSLSGNFDADGTLFASASTATLDGIVVSVAGECAGGNVQVNTFSGNVLAYDFVTVDADNHIAVQNFAGGNNAPVEVFDHPQNGVFGQPLETVSFQKSSGRDPYVGCLSGDNKLWVFYGNYSMEGSHGRALSAYAYPQGGNPIESTDFVPHPYGVTVFPAPIPMN